MTSTAGDGMSQGDGLTVMEGHQVRRLPVIGGHRLVGISQGDLAQALPDDQTGQLVESLSTE